MSRLELRMLPQTLNPKSPNIEAKPPVGWSVQFRNFSAPFSNRHAVSMQDYPDLSINVYFENSRVPRKHISKIRIRISLLNPLKMKPNKVGISL